MTGRSILRRTCALPVMVRAMPENEIPPAMRVDYYLRIVFCRRSMIRSERKRDRAAFQGFREKFSDKLLCFFSECDTICDGNLIGG